MDSCDKCKDAVAEGELKYDSDSDKLLCPECYIKTTGKKKEEIEDEDDVEGLPDDGEEGYF